ncbi:MAG: type II secretion system F family protein [Pseudomonadaceae bacterium]|jgi:type II secretory pathway component PulF|nr:type II secretion system F family protein [Pseudomonadaceae bacterium]
MPAHTFVPLPLAERAALFSQLAALEQAGVPVDRAFAMLQLLPRTQLRISVAAQQLAKGRDLASAGQLSGLFTALEVSLLQAAQSAGSPAYLYQRLAKHYAQQAQHAKSVRSRLMLPAATLLLALLVQPLPRLVGAELSLLGYLWGVLQPLGVLAALYYWGRGRLQRLQRPAAQSAGRASDAWWLSVPLLGEAYARRNVRDYWETLGLLLEAGLPMFSAMPKALASLTNMQLRQDFFALQQRVLAGESLALALRPMSFPGQPLLSRLIVSGEASGTLAAALLRYAERESAVLASFQEQLAAWLPRLAYLLVALWMAYGLLSGGIIGELPTELR